MEEAVHSNRTKEGALVRKRPADISLTDRLKSLDKASSSQPAPLDKASFLQPALYDTANSSYPAPYVQDGSKLVILQQPQKHGQRFRYSKEDRNPGILLAEGTDDRHKKYITVEVQGIPEDEEVVLVISCVTVKEPYRPHPHMLVGDYCRYGVYLSKFCGQLELTKLGIKCVKKADRKESIDQRKEKNINPFNTSYDIADVDTNAIRLCFQVYRKDEFGKYHRPLQPIVSSPILDKKSTGDLRIERYHPTSGPVDGGTEMLIFCSKVTKNDIRVCFEEEGSGWTEEVNISPADMHHMYALAFLTHPFNDPKIKTNCEVRFHLYRPSDGEVSPSATFTYTASDPQKHTSLKKSRASTTGNFQKFHKESVPRPMNHPTPLDDIYSSGESLSPTKGRSLEAESPPLMASRSPAPARVAVGTTHLAALLDASPGSEMAQLKIEGSPRPAPAPQAPLPLFVEHPQTLTSLSASALYRSAECKVEKMEPTALYNKTEPTSEAGFPTTDIPTQSYPPWDTDTAPLNSGTPTTDISQGSTVQLNDVIGVGPTAEEMIQRLQQFGFVILHPGVAQGSVEQDNSQVDMQGLMLEGNLELSSESYNELLLQQFESVIPAQNGQGAAVEP